MPVALRSIDSFEPRNERFTLLCGRSVDSQLLEIRQQKKSKNCKKLQIWTHVKPYILYFLSIVPSLICSYLPIHCLLTLDRIVHSTELSPSKSPCPNFYLLTFLLGSGKHSRIRHIKSTTLGRFPLWTWREHACLCCSPFKFHCIDINSFCNIPFTPNLFIFSRNER